jgi:hypothetical protein
LPGGTVDDIAGLRTEYEAGVLTTVPRRSGSATMTVESSLIYEDPEYV